MKEYRTEKQFDEIMSSVDNGQWSQAFELVNEYGFSHHDLFTFLIGQYGMGLYTKQTYIEHLYDIGHLIEGALKLELDNKDL